MECIKSIKRKKKNNMTNKNNFLSYIKIQRSGVTNMFDINTVMELSGLDRETILDCMKNYSKYYKLYK